MLYVDVDIIQRLNWTKQNNELYYGFLPKACILKN